MSIACPVRMPSTNKILLIFGGVQEEKIHMPNKWCHVHRNVPLRHLRKRTCSNIFQTGGVIYTLLPGKQVDYNYNLAIPPHVSNLSTELSKGLNHSVELDTEDIRQRSSKDL